MKSLGSSLPKEQARVRLILSQYRQIGRIGAFSASFIEQYLREADDAEQSQDAVHMLRAYGKLKGIQG